MRSRQRRKRRPQRGESRIDAVKVRVGIDDLIVHLGGEVKGSRSGWGPATCPFHGDKVASASVNVVEGRFHCHGCDVGGDVIDLAMEHLGTDDMTEALDWLERTL